MLTLIFCKIIIAGNDISSSRVELIFLSVFTGGKKPKNIIEDNLLDPDIWHFITGLDCKFFMRK